MALGQPVRSGANSRERRAAIFPAVLLAGIVLSGCAGTATLDPQFTPQADSAPIPRSVGVYYSPELRAYEATVVPRYQEAELTLPLGQASVSLLRQALAGIFEDVVEVGSRPLPSRPDSRFDALIEPRIENFTFRPMRTGGWRFWTVIRYGLTIRAPDGHEITRWTVRGSSAVADADDLWVWSSYTIPERAVEGAMQNAAEALAASFEEVPEAVRWRHGQPVDAGTAPATGQITQFQPQSGDYQIRGRYEPVVAVSADPYKSPDPATENITADLRKAGAFSVRLAVENLGGRRLLFRRPEIALRFPDGTALEPVSGAYLSAALTTRRTRVGGIANPPGGGLATLIVGAANLLIALRNQAASESETAQATVYELLYRSDELQDGHLGPGKTAQGYVHFRVPPRLREAEGMTLSVPVVDLDTATRYVVALPLGPIDGYANGGVID